MFGRFLFLIREKKSRNFCLKKLPQYKWFKRDIEVNNCVFSNVLKKHFNCGSFHVLKNIALEKQKEVTGSLISPY